MDGFPICQCGKGMSDCSIHPSTRESWIASMQASLAKTLALLESRQAYLREPDQVFTAKSCASLAWYDQDSCSWRTYQQSFLSDSEPYSETWPRWGMTQGGSAYAHPMSERRITETAGFYWQTPVTTGVTGGSGSREMMQSKVMNGDLSEIEAIGMLGVKLWPTPAARDYKGQNSVVSMQKKLDNGEKAQQGQLPNAVAMIGDIGQLNPNWVEWLMGFPIAFTVSKDWATRKSPCKQQQPTDSLVDSDAP